MWKSRLISMAALVVIPLIADAGPVSEAALTQHAAAREARIGRPIFELPGSRVHSNDVLRTSRGLRCHAEPRHFRVYDPARARYKDDVIEMRTVTLSMVHDGLDPDTQIIPTTKTPPRSVRNTWGEDKHYGDASPAYVAELRREILDPIRQACPDLEHISILHYFSDLFRYRTDVRPDWIPRREYSVAQTDFKWRGGQWQLTRDGKYDEPITHSSIPYAPSGEDTVATWPTEAIHKGYFMSNPRSRQEVWGRNQPAVARSNGMGRAASSMVQTEAVGSRSGGPGPGDIMDAFMTEAAQFGYRREGGNRLVPSLGVGAFTLKAVDIDRCTEEGRGFRCRYRFTTQIERDAATQVFTGLFGISAPTDKTTLESQLFVQTRSGWRSPSIAQELAASKQRRGQEAYDNVQRHSRETQQRWQQEAVDALSNF